MKHEPLCEYEAMGEVIAHILEQDIKTVTRKNTTYNQVTSKWYYKNGNLKNSERDPKQLLVDFFEQMNELKELGIVV